MLSPDNVAPEPATKNFIAQMTTESGASSRTFKSAIIWVAPEDATSLLEEARKLLAWKDIDADSGELKLDDTQQRQLAENTKRAERDLRESVWRAYKNVFLLADDNSMRKIDLGLVHSSAANSLVELILARLRQEDIVVEGVSPNFLTRYWPPALPEWSTKSVREAFYASPKFPRLLKPDAVKDTISRGLDAGTVAYVGKAADGGYQPFVYKRSMGSGDIEIADDVYLIIRERAEEYLARKHASPQPSNEPTASGGDAHPPPATPVDTPRGTAGGAPGTPPTPTPGSTSDPPPGTEIAGFRWSGDISPQKWMNFYTKVLSRFATAGGLRLTVSIEVEPPGGTTVSKVEETQVALRELGLAEYVNIKPRGSK